MFKFKVMLELQLDDNTYPDWIIEAINAQLHDSEDIIDYSMQRQDDEG